MQEYTFDLFVYPNLKKHPCTKASSTYNTVGCQCRRPGPMREKIAVSDFSDFLWETLLNNWINKKTHHDERRGAVLPVHLGERQLQRDPERRRRGEEEHQPRLHLRAVLRLQDAAAESHALEELVEAHRRHQRPDGAHVLRRSHAQPDHHRVHNDAHLQDLRVNINAESHALEELGGEVGGGAEVAGFPRRWLAGRAELAGTGSL